jgi:proteic killer suppression protein
MRHHMSGGCPRSLWDVAYRKLDHLDSATALKDLLVPPGNRLERLHGDRKGQYSVRINDRYRICFRWTESGPDEAGIVDYHRG